LAPAGFYAVIGLAAAYGYGLNPPALTGAATLVPPKM